MLLSLENLERALDVLFAVHVAPSAVLLLFAWCFALVCLAVMVIIIK